MELSHNVVFRIPSGELAGTYRVILEEALQGLIVASRLDLPNDAERPARGGRRRLAKPKRPRKKPSAPLVTRLSWLDRDELYRMMDAKKLLIVEIERKNHSLSPKDEAAYLRAKTVMAPCLNFAVLREQILGWKGLSGLEEIVMKAGGVSRYYFRKHFSRLCRDGFHETSLQPRRSQCGGKGIPRPCDPGGRKKAGRKTEDERIVRAYGLELPPVQPGMSSEWTTAVLAADATIPAPKPGWNERAVLITKSHFVTRYREENGQLIPVPPELGQYPNARQVIRILKREIGRITQILERTTLGHFNRSKRGLLSHNWKGVSGPGHTWAIDSTIGDIYLRSSINRAWILGRPVVYVIVDVWSTAVVGFYVCLTGPSWSMAKQALFSAVAPPDLIAELWGYHPLVSSLWPLPTMPVTLLCDRGEYLSQAASVTGAALIPDMAYTPPYRPDLKGGVEVLHRIEKDAMYYFIPGAIDERRKEYELRRFNPDDAILTVPEFVNLLYTIFTRYNLTAPREHRLDAHMHAENVFPSPAGLWHYGHEVGIGVRRAFPLSTLIGDLLPEEKATVGRSGVRFCGREYRPESGLDLEWSTIARNLGAWEVDAHYFGGSVSRIWTPHRDAAGMLDLRLSDLSTASPELTVEETLDAMMYGKRKNAANAHRRMIEALNARTTMEQIVARARVATAAAEAAYTGELPTLTEARHMESDMRPPPASPLPTEPRAATGAEAESAYLDMMHKVFAALGDDGVSQ